MNSNEELCDSIIPERDGAWYLLRDALTQGILIPAEKMLTEQELVGIQSKEAYETMKPLGSHQFSELVKDGHFHRVAKAIHQSSRQKAGIK